ncbi:MAG: hypothetical protein IKN47_03790 [Lachnospiraceae bacterium]|nr:hypothetical protein [Lachnospiraceae bacterium]
MNNKRLFEFIDCLSVISFFIIFFRKAGATGAGIFAAAIFFYYILYVIFIEGVGNTMAKMVAVRVRRGFKENARKVFGYVMLYTFFMGALILFVFISASDSISQALFKDPTAGAVICFVGMLFFVHGFSHNIKYYYIGCGGHSLQTIADIVRDIILPVGLYFTLDKFSDIGTKVAALKNDDIQVGVYTSIGAVLVICAALLARLLILLAGIRGLIRHDYSFNEVRTKDGFRTFMRSFLPEYIRYIRKAVFPIIAIFTAVMVFSRVNFQLGATKADVYTKLGLIAGPATAFLMFAVRAFGSYATYIYAKIKASVKKEDKKNMVARYNGYAKNTLIIAIPAFVALLVFSKPICTAVFNCNAEEAFTLALISAFAFLFAAVDAFFSAGLRATGYELVDFLGNAVGFVVLLIYILVAGKKGVPVIAYAVAFLMYYIVSMLIHGFYAISYIGLKSYDIASKAVKILIGVAPMFILDLILVKLVTMNIVIILVSLLIGYVIYWTVFILARGLNQKELTALQGTFVYFPLRFIAGLFHIR